MNGLMGLVGNEDDFECSLFQHAGKRAGTLADCQRPLALIPTNRDLRRGTVFVAVGDAGKIKSVMEKYGPVEMVDPSGKSAGAAAQ